MKVMINALVQLTENDKRLIISLLLIFFLLFIIAGYIGLLVKKIMHFQGKRADDLVHDVVVAGVIEKRGKLYRFGTRKNYNVLLKQAWIPFLIMFASSLILVVYLAIIDGWDQNIFGYNKETDPIGFSSILFIFDFKNAEHSNFFGMSIISNWPPCINYPHFEVEAIPTYLFVFGMLVGGLWFLVCVQAFIARQYRLYILTKKVFNKSLENYNPNNQPVKFDEETKVQNDATKNEVASLDKTDNQKDKN